MRAARVCVCVCVYTRIARGKGVDLLQDDCLQTVRYSNKSTVQLQTQ